jgi:hypothetical protein
MDRKIINFPTAEQRQAKARPATEAPRPQTDEPMELSVTIPRALPGPRTARY